MEAFPISPRSMVSSLMRNRGLVAALVKRDVLGRYRGSVLGLAWSLVNPLVMLLLYWFVFGVIFKSRWVPEGAEREPHFAVALFAGLLVFNIFADCISRAPMLITSNVSYVKKIIFPLEVLPVVTLLSALFHSLVGVLMLCLVQLVVHGSIPWTVIVWPVLLIPTGLIALGLSWFLSSLGVYLRDVSQVTGILVNILLFLSAIFFPLSALPPLYAHILTLNPLVHVVEASRSLLVRGVIPSPGVWIVVTCTGWLVSYLGYVWFQKSRRGFADVL